MLDAYLFSYHLISVTFYYSNVNINYVVLSVNDAMYRCIICTGQLVTVVIVLWAEMLEPCVRGELRVRDVEMLL